MPSQTWISANRRRLLLALYFDFCLMSAVLGLIWHFVYLYNPTLHELPLYAEISLFLVVEFTIWSQLRWSPGASLLSIQFMEPTDTLTPMARGGTASGSCI